MRTWTLRTNGEMWKRFPGLNGEDGLQVNKSALILLLLRSANDPVARQLNPLMFTDNPGRWSLRDTLAAAHKDATLAKHFSTVLVEMLDKQRHIPTIKVARVPATDWIYDSDLEPAEAGEVIVWDKERWLVASCGEFGMVLAPMVYFTEG